MITKTGDRTSINLFGISMIRSLLTRSTFRTIGARTFRTSGKVLAADPEPSMMQQFINADKPAKFVKLYHLSTFACLALVPVALAVPNAMSMPLDLAMGVIFPVHGHIGFNYIISDYVPKAGRGTARTFLLGVTGVTLLGLLKLNVAGDGLTETVKSMWKKPEKKSK